MDGFENIVIDFEASLKKALVLLDKQKTKNCVLFVRDKDSIVGTVTDGDIRRALLGGSVLDDNVATVMVKDFKYFSSGRDNLSYFKSLKQKEINVAPVLDKDGKMLRVINLSKLKSFLPVDAVIMAGGLGKRLRPLTDNCPKPMLRINEKPIIEYNIDRLAQYGVVNIHIAINYLGSQISDYFGDGKSKSLNIGYVTEKKRLGTIGAIGLIDNFQNDYVLIMNSDLLTTIDFAEFFEFFLKKNADMAVAAVPYNVDVPYAVMELDDNSEIKAFKEKPTYTYFSNAGIYLVKKELLSCIPKNSEYDATDLMEFVRSKDGGNIVAYPVLSYWRDIGRLEDYNQAQQDAKHIHF